MIEFIFLGIIIGLLIGLIPGLHINSILPFLLLTNNENLIALIISSSIAFIFSSSFSTILFGVPSTDFLLMLPTHKLVKRGEAAKAITISLNSMLLSVIFSIPFIFLLFLIKHFYFLFEKIIPLILTLTLLSFVLKSKKSIIIIILSGLLGFLTFHFNLLFPLLTGFFAAPNLLFSFDSKVNIQFFRKTKFSKKLIRTSFSASFLSSIFSIIPTISSSIVSTVAEKLGKLSDEEFISFISSTNLSYMVFSFYALPLLGIARSGSSVFLKTLDGNSFFYLGIIFISAGFSFFICKKILFSIVKFYQKINPKLLPVLGIFTLILFSFLLNGFIGLLVLFTSSAIGLLAFILKIPRISCMSSLIIPTVFALL